MSTNTIRNDVITTYKAETDQHRRQLHSLAQSEKRFADEARKAAADRAQAWKDMASAATAALGVVGVGIAVAKAGFDEYRAASKLAAASSSIDVGRIAAAAGGLKTNMEIMRLSAMAASGAWKLNTAQLEQVVIGMRALEAKGFETVDVTNKITDALKKGKTEGLDDFGISLKATGDKAKDLNAFLKQMGAEATDVGFNFDKAGDDVARSGVKAENALSNIKIAIGRLVVAMAPMIDALADMATGLANVVGLASQLPGVKHIGSIGKAVSYVTPWGQAGHVFSAIANNDNPFDYGDRQYAGYDATRSTVDNTFFDRNQRQFAQAGAGQQRDQTTASWAKLTAGQYAGRGSAIDTQLFDPAADTTEAAKEAGRLIMRSVVGKIERVAYGSLPDVLGGRGGVDAKGGGSKGTAAPGFLDELGWKYDEYQRREEYLRLSAGSAVEADSAGAWKGLRDEDLSPVTKYNDLAGGMKGRAAQWEKDVLAGFGEQRQTMLEKIFGPVSEFDLYSTAWKGLETVVTASFNAWIDGSKSIGSAMKEALHGFAKQLAGEAVLQALRHTAYGFGLLPFPDPLSKISASQHFAAAAKWAGVAVAAGAYAKVTAPAAGGGRAGASAAAGMGTAPGSSGSGGANITLVSGDPFATDSPRYVARRTTRALQNARLLAGNYETGAV